MRSPRPPGLCPWRNLPWRLGSHPVGDVLHVFVGQHGGKALHDRVVALAGLELLQLLDQVFGVLLGQLGIDWNGELPSAPWHAAHTAV
jgi:hypothetical protein